MPTKPSSLNFSPKVLGLSPLLSFELIKNVVKLYRRVWRGRTHYAEKTIFVHGKPKQNKKESSRAETSRSLTKYRKNKMYLPSFIHCLLLFDESKP
jgi:hypothetical protein